jgi:hypothetical protein
LYLATSETDPYIPSNFDELRRLMNDSISTSIVAISANLSKGYEFDAAGLTQSNIEGTSFQGEGSSTIQALIFLSQTMVKEFTLSHRHEGSNIRTNFGLPTIYTHI